MGTAYRNRIGCDLISIYMLFYIFLLTFPSVACFRCRRYPLYRREREKVFGGNTLCLQRKIPPETVQPPDLFTFKEVCTNFNGRARKYATDGICIWSIRILVVLLPLSVVYVFNIIAIPVPFRNFILGLNARTDSFYILINFLAGQFCIQLCCTDILVPHHLTDGFQWNTLRKSNQRTEIMPGHMKCYPFVYIASLRQFLEVGSQCRTCRNFENPVIHTLFLVFVHNLLW